MNLLELAASVVTVLSIWLATRNSVHTWPTGIVGCALFAVQFFLSQLYADASLQLLYIATSIIGWQQWRRRRAAAAVTRAAPRALAWMATAALVVTLAYGWLLHRFTDAHMPFIDASVLSLSVVAQCLLMQRKLQTWPWWLAANTVSVPLFASRGLWLTAVLYAVYWLMALYGWRRWRRETHACAASRLAAANP